MERIALIGGGNNQVKFNEEGQFGFQPKYKIHTAKVEIKLEEGDTLRTLRDKKVPRKS